MMGFLWYVKGYSGNQLTKLNIKKYSFDEIKKSYSSINDEIENVLENDGVVLSLSKKKSIKGIYLFKITKTKDKTKKLVLYKKIVLEEINNYIEKIEHSIESILGSIITYRPDIDKAIWKDKEIDNKREFKDTSSAVKVFAWIGIIILCSLTSAMIVVSTIYSLECFNNPSIENIRINESIMNYISSINNYDYFEIKNIIETFENSHGLAIVEIIIPTVFKVLSNMLFILVLKYVLDFVKNISDNKTLFTEEKMRLLKKILLVTLIAIFFTIDNFILWIFLAIIADLIFYMFNYGVCFTKNK